jgi:hypothetical protein
MEQTMSDLEERLREESTEVLLHKIRTNSLTDEATAIARTVLSRRNVAIPIPETEEAAEAKIRASTRRSTLFFYSIVAWAGLVWLYSAFHENDPKKLGDFVYWSGLATFWPFVIYRKRS